MEIKFEDVLCAYSGRKEGCRCGCLGKYYYRSDAKEIASKDRGYEVRDNECNDKMVKKVIKLISEADKVEVDGNIFNIEMENGRVYTIYLLDKE